MSTIKANDIQNASGGIPTVKGQRLIPTAWVNFNQSTNVINDSENISSLTDIGVGRTYVNFTTNMANTNYACVTSAKQGIWSSSNTGAAVYAVNYVYILNVDGGNFADSTIIAAAVFGGQ
tara:strand:+ start:1089 stop:1448 length:360 start_codon:yes stop_codon:yes gene_type:complete